MAHAASLGDALSSWVLEPSRVLSHRYHAIFLPGCRQLAERLELPAWDVYRNAWASCTRDALRALASAYTLFYLTLKPIAILLWILAGHLWKFVLEHGGRSLQHFLWHLKLALIHFYRFQRSLNGTQLLAEAFLVAVCIGLYYLRKWLLRQTYTTQMIRWYKRQKRKLIKSYTEFVHRVARVSRLSAMALPHLLFAGGCFGLAIVAPGLLAWITYETPTLNLLSVYYPFVSTLLWIHTRRHDIDWNQPEKETNGAASAGTNKNQGSTDKKESEESQAAQAETEISTAKSKIAQRQQKFEAMASANTKSSVTTPAFVRERAAIQTTNYWLRYWQLYAIVRAVGSFLSMVPLVGRLLLHHPKLAFVTGECQLVLFVWVFAMEKLLGSLAATDASDGASFLAEATPLRLVHKFVTPWVSRLHRTVSETIPQEPWQKWVVAKTQTVLSVAVLVKAVSEDTKVWLVQLTEQARVLVLPSITLLMPGSVTQLGVAYVRFVVPVAAQSERTSGSTKLAHLEYWILHGVLAGLWEATAGVWWWIPFSNHALFCVWAGLIVPSTVARWYGLLASELVALGLLPATDAGATTPWSETRTARLVGKLLERLPSADGLAAKEASRRPETPPLPPEADDPDAKAKTE